MSMELYQRSGTNNNRITRLNHTHDFMVDWMIAHPGGKMKDLAEILGYDSAWVSVVTHSDMFQALYQTRLRECHEEGFDVREAKLKAGAIEAVDCIREKLAGTVINGVQVGPSERFVIDAAKTLLPAAGYSAPAVSKQEPQRHLHLHVDSELLARSRERMRARFGTLVEAPSQQDAQEPAETTDAEISQAFEQMALFEEVA